MWSLESAATAAADFDASAVDIAAIIVAVGMDLALVPLAVLLSAQNIRLRRFSIESVRSLTLVQEPGIRDAADRVK